jgi:purine-nucleoside phosphorylase
MEAATLLQLATRHGCAAGCVLIVSDGVLPHRRRLEDEALAAAGERMGRVAAEALSAAPV